MKTAVSPVRVRSAIGAVPNTKRRVTGESNTLHRLRVLRAAGLASLLMWLVVGMSVMWQSHVALGRAQRILIPETAAVQEMKTSLAAMDAAEAEQLLRPAEATERVAGVAEENRTALVGSLIRAAETGEANRGALASLESGLGTYERLVQRAHDLRDRQDGARWEAYRQALGVVDEQLTPKIRSMDRETDGELRTLAQQQNRLLATGGALFAVCSFLVIAVLLASQMFLSRRTRRTLNPALLGGTLALLVASGQLLHTGGKVQEIVRSGLGEAYPALHAGWQARAAAGAARDQESRAALDRGRGATYLQAAANDREEVATLPVTLNEDQLLGALREGRAVDGFGGDLADEIAAARRPGERGAAIQALNAWLRASHGAGAAAAMGSVGSAAAFERALNTALQAHERDLTGALEQGIAEQARAEWVLGVVTALGCVLVLLGFAPRIQEYK